MQDVAAKYLGSTNSPECQADRNVERSERKLNGNAPRREQAKYGATLNPLLGKLLIARRCLNELKSGAEKEGWAFFCIACDHPSKNGAEARILPHAVDCTILARDFRDTWLEAVERNGGKTKELKAVRGGKRDIEEVAREEGEEMMRQASIEESFTPLRMTAKLQNHIDFLLFRMVICCFLAFSLLDNFFFVTFVKAL
jgi:hypothetical protein